MVKKVEGVEASVQLRCISEGDALVRREMRAVSTKCSTTGIEPRHKNADSDAQTSRFKLVFSTAQGKYARTEVNDRADLRTDVGEFQRILHKSM